MQQQLLTDRLVGFFLLLFFIMLNILTITQPRWELIIVNSIFSLTYGAYVETIGTKYKGCY